MVFEVILELFTIISPCTSVEHVLLKIHHCTYLARKMEFMHNFGMNDLLLQNKIMLRQENFRMTFFITAQTAFHHSTF